MTALHPSTARRPEGNVPPVRTQAAGLAMVIITAGHDVTVNIQDKLRGHGLVRRQRAQPAVGGVSGPQLPLGTGQIGTCRSIGSQGFVLFALGELGAFDARGAGGFQSQLLLVDLLNPSGQVRHPIQNAGGGFGPNQQVQYGCGIVAHPLLWDDIAADTFRGHLDLIFKSFSVYFKFISRDHIVFTGT